MLSGVSPRIQWTLDFQYRHYYALEYYAPIYLPRFVTLSTLFEYAILILSRRYYFLHPIGVCTCILVLRGTLCNVTRTFIRHGRTVYIGVGFRGDWLIRIAYVIIRLLLWQWYYIEFSRMCAKHIRTMLCTTLVCKPAISVKIIHK